MLISVNEVQFGYDDKIIIDTTSVEIGANDRIGLVGANGEGKTTFINLLLKFYEPNDGDVNFKSNLTFGYLKQSEGLEADKTVFCEMRSVFSKVIEAEDRMRQIEHQMSQICDHDGIEYKSLTGEYNRLNAYFEANDGYNIDVKIKTVLNGMGLQNRYDSMINHMSGGEKTRLAICKLLLLNPELLVLDEPTNHLDFSTLAWLEKYLEGYKGALLIVSHDRFFLDKTVTKIWDLENKTISEYNGNYSKYKQLKKERLDYQMKEYTKQSKKIDSMLDYVQKNIARDSTSKMAKSRLHQLANMDIIEKPKTYKKLPRFNFTFERETVKDVLSIKNLKLSIGERVLVDNINMNVYKGDRVAIVGANGTGKTTFLKTIMGLKGDTFGNVILGKWVKLAYYDQENLNLDPEQSVISELWGNYHRLSQTEVRKILAQVLLFEEDINKKVFMLSGGERAKLGFAILIAEHGNVLVLDEPTNHLDLDSREALEEGLNKFEGTIIFVSHDRYFLNAIANKFVEFEDCQMNEYIGNFDNYQEEKRERIEENIPDVVVKEVKNKTYRTAKDRSIEVSLKKEIKEIEESMRKLDEELQMLYKDIQEQEVISSYQLMKEKCDRIEVIKSSMQELELAWFEKTQELSEFTDK